MAGKKNLKRMSQETRHRHEQQNKGPGKTLLLLTCDRTLTENIFIHCSIKLHSFNDSAVFFPSFIVKHQKSMIFRVVVKILKPDNNSDDLKGALFFISKEFRSKKDESGSQCGSCKHQSRRFYLKLL